MWFCHSLILLVGHKDSLIRHNKSRMWPAVLEKMSENGNFGPAFPLVCQQHPNTVTLVKDPEDFSRVIDGGCSLNCGFQMNCGHVCSRKCHPDDRNHTKFPCPRPCMRIRPISDCPSQHPCPLLCHQDCGKCMTDVRVTLDTTCNHTLTVKCHQSLKKEEIKCSAHVKAVAPICGHENSVTCHQKKSVEQDQKLCRQKCGALLACTHQCAGICGKCAEKNTHVKCTISCTKILPCGHTCGKPCHGKDTDCPPCTQNCTQKCAHAQCSKKCQEVCVPCLEKCTWRCEHVGECQVPCGAPCSRLPCDKRCTKKLLYVKKNYGKKISEKSQRKSHRKKTTEKKSQKKEIL